MPRRAPPAPSVRVGPNGRILALSVAWFSDGADRRREARRTARCVECSAALPNHRTPYCSRTCQWRFHGHYFWDSARSYVMLRDRYRCQICGARRRARELDVDHIVEIARGGAALEYSNLQTVCRQCHRAKTRAFMAGGHRPPSGVPPGPDPPPTSDIADPL
ncbi:MAG: HNH endonuclease signature motif containing protein [Thermoplasmata archaeon]|jgi:5-methylcytosine-specific restriction endonuclease McrA